MWDPFLLGVFCIVLFCSFSGTWNELTSSRFPGRYCVPELSPQPFSLLLKATDVSMAPLLERADFIPEAGPASAGLTFPSPVLDCDF